MKMQDINMADDSEFISYIDAAVMLFDKGYEISIAEDIGILAVTGFGKSTKFNISKDKLVDGRKVQELLDV